MQLRVGFRSLPLEVFAVYRPLLVVSRVCHWRWTPLLQRVCMLLRDEGVPVFQIGECDAKEVGTGWNPLSEHLPGIARLNLPTGSNWREDPIGYLRNRKRVGQALEEIVDRTNPRAVIFENCDLAGVVLGVIRRFPDLPVVYWATELSCRLVQAPYRRDERRIARRLRGLIMNNPDRIRIWCERAGMRVPAVMLPNTEIRLAKTEAVENGALRRAFARINPEVDVIFLYTGIVSHKQAVADVVAALREVPDRVGFAYTNSVGDSKYIRKIQRMVDDFRLTKRVIQSDWVPFDRLAELTSSSDVGVALLRVNDLNTKYAASSKLYRYLAAGLPVLVSSNPSVRRVVEEEKVGIACDPDSVEDISAAMRTLENDTVRRELAANAREAFHNRLCLEVYWERERERILDWIGLEPRSAGSFAAELRNLIGGSKAE